MARIEILVEEQSMEQLLRALLPKIAPANWVLDENYFVRPHQGKQDLQKSIPSKVKVFSNWHEPAAIVIVQDQDSSDCIQLKQKIRELCGDTHMPVLVRIVCRELESWYLGAPQAIARAYPKFNVNNIMGKAKFRNTDSLNNVKEELRKYLPDYKMIESAKRIAPYMKIEGNKSESFCQFISGMTGIFNSF